MSKTANTILTVAILVCMAILLLYGYCAIQKLDDTKVKVVSSGISKHINYKEEVPIEEENMEVIEEDGTAEDDDYEEYIEEEEAEEVIENIVVDTPEEIEETVPEVPTAKVDAAYLVIAGSYQFLANAQTKAQQLKKMGMDAEIVSLQKSNLHSICIAKSETEQEANDTLAALINKHKIKAFVYKVP